MSASSPAAVAAVGPTVASPLPDMIARDAMVAWFCGEFAAANAIIDALCNHLTQICGPDQISEYESVLVAIHRRRLNWIPVLQMQKYYSIAEIAIELRRLSEKEERERARTREKEEEISVSKVKIKIPAEKEKYSKGSVVHEDLDGGDSSDQKTESGEGSHAENQSSESFRIFSNNEDSKERPSRIKITKGFVAKEPVKGHMVNVVKGLKLYEDIFTELELSKLTNYINELRLAGQKGELLGDTFILFNQQLKGNKREIIQLGAPIFTPMKDDVTNNIEPIPLVLQAVIDHLVDCRLIPERRKPNSCIINFFDEGEYSQPYMKPPHLDQPVSTLLLSESNMAFGRALVSDDHGNFRGPLMLSLKEGSLLVMRGNSVDMARHVMCPSPNKRVSLTFLRVRVSESPRVQPSDIPPLTKAMTLWQPGGPQPHKLPNERPTTMGMIPKWGVLGAAPMVMIAPAPSMVVGPARRISREGTGVLLPWQPGGPQPHKLPNGRPTTMGMIPKWGLLGAAPLVMIAPAPSMVVGPARRISREGTRVFLPWTTSSRKSTRHLPPRIQRGRFASLPTCSMESDVVKQTPSIDVAGLSSADRRVWNRPDARGPDRKLISQVRGATRGCSSGKCAVFRGGAIDITSIPSSIGVEEPFVPHRRIALLFLWIQ